MQVNVTDDDPLAKAREDSARKAELKQRQRRVPSGGRQLLFLLPTLGGGWRRLWLYGQALTHGGRRCTTTTPWWRKLDTQEVSNRCSTEGGRCECLDAKGPRVSCRGMMASLYVVPCLLVGNENDGFWLDPVRYGHTVPIYLVYVNFPIQKNYCKKC